ncbi:MAG: hypothetical protein IPL65_10270 [Lewinellaceae bacterium]|nr:hypothetical protein [Lewinellaceae bacterium]
MPQWQDRGFRVMVLPFENLGEISSNPAAALIDSIVLLTQRNDLPVEVHTSKRPDAQAGNHENAADLGASCNAELVVWGKYMAFSNDSIRIRFGYVFVREGEEHLGAFNSFADVTEVGPDRDLHDVLFSICSMLAMNNHRDDLAKSGCIKSGNPTQKRKM